MQQKNRFNKPFRGNQRQNFSRNSKRQDKPETHQLNERMKKLKTKYFELINNPRMPPMKYINTGKDLLNDLNVINVLAHGTKFKRVLNDFVELIKILVENQIAERTRIIDESINKNMEVDLLESDV